MFDTPTIGDEDTLLAAIKEGDQKAFSLLYDKYAPALLGVISKIIDDKQQAEETLTCTFMQAWRLIADFKGAGSLFSWLLALARKTALEKAAKENQPCNKGVYDAVKKRITGSLQQYEDNSAFNLLYYKGLCCHEAATALNITIEELSSEIRKTIQSLKENKITC